MNAVSRTLTVVAVGLFSTIVAGSGMLGGAGTVGRASNAGMVYSPPAGAVPYFRNSPFAQKIPNPPSVNPNSPAWVAALGNFSLNTLIVWTAPPYGATPVYYNHQGKNMPVRIHCTASWYAKTPCNVEGDIIYVDPSEVPGGGGCTPKCTGDAHLAIIDPAAGYEYDFWQAVWPPSGGVLTVAAGGRCALSGNGFTTPSYSGPNVGCNATASSVPLSMLSMRAEDVVAAVKTGSTLPQAIGFAARCVGTAPPRPPFGSVSNMSNCPSGSAAPEGAHLYLAMHDADVNALGLAPITSVILRTLDEDHYGAYVTDTGGDEGGLQIDTESDATYEAWGQPGPWLHSFLPLAQSEGLPGSCCVANGAYHVGLPIPSSVANKVRFL